METNIKLEKYIDMILNDEVKDKKTYKEIDKFIMSNWHLIGNKKKIIDKMDKIEWKILYGI